MSKIQQGTYQYKGYEYKYSIRDIGESDEGKIVYLYCRGAGISQEFLYEDALEIIENLETYIDIHQEHQKSVTLKLRMTQSQKKRLESFAKKSGKSMSEVIINSLPQDIAHVENILVK